MENQFEKTTNVNADNGDIETPKPQRTCQNCGAPMAEGQMFCPTCGAKQIEKPKKICANCGMELAADQEFCPRCGQRYNMAINVPNQTAMNNAPIQNVFEQYNANLPNQNKRGKAKPAVIAAVIVAVVAFVAIFSNVASQKKSEQARAEYLANAAEFMDVTIDAGSNLENIADTLQEYWYDCIWYDKYGDDINQAIATGLRDKAEEIEDAKDNDSRVKALYNKVRVVPDAIKGEDREGLDAICRAVNDLYDVYEDFYELATDPSGNYNSYKQANSDLTDEFIECFETLHDLLN